MGRWEVNTYVISYKNHAWLIDVGGNREEIAASLDKKEYNGLLLTHGHFDHVGDISDFIFKGNIPLYIHSADRKLLARANLYRKITGEETFYKSPKISGYFEDHKDFKLWDKKIKVLHTPGHTQGSVCFIVDNNLFTGDLLMKEGSGRTDMPGGNQEKLKASVQVSFNQFKGFTVYPGHGEPFTLDTSFIANYEV